MQFKITNLFSFIQHIVKFRSIKKIKRKKNKGKKKN